MKKNSRWPVALLARVSQEQSKKVEEMTEKTGLSVSQLFRQMIDAAQLEPAHIEVKVIGGNDEPRKK